MFPSLAKDMAYSSFVRNYIAGSGCSMRFGRGGWAIDGALACVIKAYLCVRQADPTGVWLKTVYPNIKDQMQIIMTKFDLDGDGCIRSAQQNTYGHTSTSPSWCFRMGPASKSHAPMSALGALQF
jgi:hypothetical protein